MIDMNTLQNTVIDGIRDYLNIPVIYAHRLADAPAYPYGSYVITNLINENKKSWSRCDDGKERKCFTQTWTIMIQSDNVEEATNLALQAYDWLDCAGVGYLGDHHIVIQSLTAVSNQDNVISSGYEYRYGFDVTFTVESELEGRENQVGTIETTEITYDKNE